MKHKKLFVSLILAMAAALLVSGILFFSPDFSSQRVSVDLYFMDESGTGIIAERHDIRYRDGYDFVEKTIEKLKNGPSVSKHGKILSRDVTIRNISFSAAEGEGLTVDLSSEFLTNDPSKNVLSTYAVVKSLCSIGWIPRVRVTVMGQDITDADGNKLGYVAASDINLETEEYSSEMRDVVLYFADSTEEGLVRESRTIKVTDQQPIEQYIINELIKGPVSSDLHSVLSEDTVLMSADVEDNVCYLNFRSDFLSQNEGNGTHERLVIYSIVNSLTELNTIDRVQFYMDGRRIDSFGSIELKNYISRDTSIIK